MQKTLNAKTKPVSPQMRKKRIARENRRRFWLDLFFPNRCPGCQRSIPWNWLLCRKCLDRISEWEEHMEQLCPGCGAAVCRCEQMIFQGCFAVAPYEDAAKNIILSMKDGCVENGACFFGNGLAELLEERTPGSPSGYWDAVVPVPMHWKKKLLRGYNQAEELARAVSERIGVPVYSGFLKARASKKEQHELSFAEERDWNAQRKFYLSPHISSGILEGKRVLLCDDVLTTGSTMNACARLLTDLGAKEVCALTATVTL